MTQRPELDAETKARIEAEEAYRAQLRAGQTPPKRKGRGMQIGCGTLVALALLLAVMVQCSNNRAGRDGASATTSAGGVVTVRESDWTACPTRAAYEQLAGLVAAGDQVAWQRAFEENGCATIRQGQRLTVESGGGLSGVAEVRYEGETQTRWTASEAVR